MLSIFDLSASFIVISLLVLGRHGMGHNVDGFAQADQIKTTLRPSDTKIQFYFSEASTQRLVQNRMLCAVALFELNTVGHQNPGHCANR